MVMPPDPGYLQEIKEQMQRWEDTGVLIQDVHADLEAQRAQFKLNNLLCGNQSHLLCF